MQRITAKTLKVALQHAYQSLDAHKEEVNSLNVFPVPDGDTGTNMTLTMEAAVQALDRAPEEIEAMAKALGQGSLMGARGNSGVILSQLCRGFASSVKGKESLDGKDIADLLEAARQKAYKAVMKPTEGTILTVSRAMSEFANANYSKYDDLVLFLKDLLRHANHVLQQTPDMLAELKEAGVVDSGGQGLVYLALGFVEGLTGEDLSDLLESSKTVPPRSQAAQALLEEEEADYAYFVEFTISGIEKDRMLRHLAHYGKLKELQERGQRFRVEAYSDSPIRLLASQDKRGQLEEVHVLRATQQINRTMNDPAYGASSEEEATPKTKDFGFVAVCAGQGFAHIFQELGVDQLVEGGQTMNPSTRDLWEASEKIPAKTIFILPNNKNIILAADQVGQLSDKEIIVLPTKSMPEGIAAIIQFMATASAQENKKAMLEAMESITTGQVTYAIRDTEINGLRIHKGDQIGLVGGDIVASGKDAKKVLGKLLEKYITDDHSLLAIYLGADCRESDQKDLEERIRSDWPQLEVEISRGDQPVYSYIFSLE